MGLAELYTGYDFGPWRSRAVVRKHDSCAFGGRVIRISTLSIIFGLNYIWYPYTVLFHVCACFASRFLSGRIDVELGFRNRKYYFVLI